MILFMAAAVWGVAFVAQSVGMDYVGPFTFVAVRNVVALAVLVPCAVVMDNNRKKGRNRNGCIRRKIKKRSQSVAYAVAYVFLPRVPCSSLA